MMYFNSKSNKVPDRIVDKQLSNCVRHIANAETAFFSFAEFLGCKISFAGKNSIKNFSNKKINENFLIKIEEVYGVEARDKLKESMEVFKNIRGSIFHLNFLGLCKSIPGMIDPMIDVINEKKIIAKVPLSQISLEYYNKMSYEDSLRWLAQHRILAVSKLWVKDFSYFLEYLVKNHPHNKKFKDSEENRRLKRLSKEYGKLHKISFHWEANFRILCKNHGIDLFEEKEEVIQSKKIDALKKELFSKISMTKEEKQIITNFQFLRNKLVHGVLVEFIKKMEEIFKFNYKNGMFIQIDIKDGGLNVASELSKKTAKENEKLSFQFLVWHIASNKVAFHFNSYMKDVLKIFSKY